MRLCKASYRDAKTGKSKKTANYYVEFRDHRDQVRRLPALSEKAQSEAFGRKAERLVACRLSGSSLEPDLVRWVETIPRKIRTRLVKLDFLDARFAQGGCPLAEHLA